MSNLALVDDSNDEIDVPGAASVRADADPTVEITITELVAIEERLAHQAHLGDLHPEHARRLSAVTAELDRRWSAYA